MTLVVTVMLKRVLGYLVYTLKRVKGTANFVSSISKIVERLLYTRNDTEIIEGPIRLVDGPCIQPCIVLS